jgi:hypothetical protein
MEVRALISRCMQAEVRACSVQKLTIMLLTMCHRKTAHGCHPYNMHPFALLLSTKEYQYRQALLQCTCSDSMCTYETHGASAGLPSTVMHHLKPGTQMTEGT